MVILFFLFLAAPIFAFQPKPSTRKPVFLNYFPSLKERCLIVLTETDLTKIFYFNQKPGARSLRPELYDQFLEGLFFKSSLDVEIKKTRAQELLKVFEDFKDHLGEAEKKVQNIIVFFVQEMEEKPNIVFKTLHNIQTTSYVGKTWLQAATKKGAYDVCEFLVKQGARPDHSPNITDSPLLMTIKEGSQKSLSLITLFLSRAHANNRMYNYLYNATKINFRDAIDLLLKCGADPKEKEQFVILGKIVMMDTFEKLEHDIQNPTEQTCPTLLTIKEGLAFLKEKYHEYSKNLH